MKTIAFTAKLGTVRSNDADRNENVKKKKTHNSFD